ncbi:hypothetical protein LSAT2_015551 [Lamellibrachia satsuma]|nr:hypothetical protein LSAT2_015551 [Lamellibrachia satsuma]
MYGRTLFVVVVMLCEALVASGQPCPTGHYMAPGDSPGGQCKPCSSCPLNQIIRKPCTAYRDNVCGPFYEFEFFNQGHHESRSMPPSFAVTPTKTADSAAGNVQEAKAGLVSSVDNDAAPSPAIQQGEEQWKKLCLVLIGILSVLCVLILVYVVISHIRARAHHRMQKTFMINDPENGNMYYEARLITVDHLHRTDLKQDLVHLERQLERNKHRRWLQRIFRPAGRFRDGNDYVDRLVDPAAGPFLLDTIPETETNNRSSPPQTSSSSVSSSLSSLSPTSHLSLQDLAMHDTDTVESDHVVTASSL